MAGKVKILQGSWPGFRSHERPPPSAKPPEPLPRRARYLSTSSPAGLPSRAASAERLFRLGLKEGDTLLKACLAAATSAGVSRASARPTCACGLRVTESTLTRAEFDTYTDWQVQTRTWRRFVFFWKPPPSEIIARLERASRQCPKPAR